MLLFLYLSPTLGGLTGRTGSYVISRSGLVFTLRPDQTGPFRSLPVGKAR